MLCFCVKLSFSFILPRSYERKANKNLFWLLHQTWNASVTFVALCGREFVLYSSCRILPVLNTVKKVAANMMLHSGSMKRSTASSCFFTSAKFVNFHITSSSRLKWCFICFSPTQPKVFSCLKSTLVIVNQPERSASNLGPDSNMSRPTITVHKI